MRKRSDSRPVDGILLLDKPAGLSSNTALQRIKRLYRAERAGHTGTLDPLATGLLPICMGEATKFGGSLLESDKAYIATVKLGERTDTGDAAGTVLERREVAVDQAALEAALKRFRGTLEQVPPMYSALKQEGRPLYELARQGKTVERKPRTVQLHRVELVSFNSPFFTMDVACSKGTYIRTLAEDVGSALGCGAHITALRRTAAGVFQIDQCLTLDALEEVSEVERDGFLLPLDLLVRSWPRTELSEAAAMRFRHGEAVHLPERGSGNDACKTAVYERSGGFLGLGNLDGSGVLKPHRLLKQDSNPEPGLSQKP